MACKGCDRDIKLIKAHAIPEAFFVGLRNEQDPPRVITDTAGVFPKRAPIGIYDNGILCRDCEDMFQKVDDYGQKLLLQDEENHVELKHNGRVDGYKVEQVDYKLLKLFVLSVLWRASVSTQPFYAKVALGPYEEEIKKLIWSSDAGKNDQFSFVVSKFRGAGVGRTILDPHRERWEGINYYRLYMYGYVFYIKVDKRPTPKLFRDFVLFDGEPLIIIGRDIHNSKEYPVMLSVVKKSRS
ncbi:hypothetical protein [Marinobacterium aestuariivivens]|uniref:HNH endonuclease 5 domain-containing protein n=1 Tax=Marinobacterium aestuariivivens TaxID=1698799 RepID=A0ABW2A990_9GAMM